MILKDAIKFSIKDKFLGIENIKGENLFTKTMDVRGNHARVRKYTNKNNSTILEFTTVERLFKEGKLNVIEGDIDEG